LLLLTTAVNSCLILLPSADKCCQEQVVMGEFAQSCDDACAAVGKECTVDVLKTLDTVHACCF